MPYLAQFYFSIHILSPSRIKPLFEGVFQEIADIFKFVTNTILSILDVFVGIFTGDWSRVSSSNPVRKRFRLTINRQTTICCVLTADFAPQTLYVVFSSRDKIISIIRAQAERIFYLICRDKIFPQFITKTAHWISILLTIFLVIWIVTQWAAPYKYSVFNFIPTKKG